MKILQINKFYYLHRGAERYYFNLTKLLEDHDHEVIPFAMANIKNKATPYQDYFSKNINLQRPDYSWQSIKKIKDIIYNKGAQADLAKLIMKTRPQIAHLHNIYHHLSPSILPVLKHFKLPVVMTIHDFKLISPDYSIFINGRPADKYKKHKYFNTVLHRAVKNSYGASAVAALESYIHDKMKIYQKNIDVFIAPSQFVKNIFIEWGWPAVRIKVIPHFIELGKRIMPRKGQNYMFYFGGLEPGKGIDAVIKTLYKEKIDLDLHIAGEGSQRKELEALVKKYNLHLQVEFLGNLNDQELAEEIRSCKFVIVPSKQYETFGLTVLESFAGSKPVLISSQGALPELVNGDVGRIFSPYQKGSLAVNLRAMIEDDNLEEMGKRGYELVKTQYGPEKHYQQILETYEQLLGDKL